MSESGEVPIVIDSREMLLHSHELVAAHLVGGAFSGLGGMKKTGENYRGFIEQAVTPTAAAILAADSARYATRFVGLNGITETYAQFLRTEHPLVAAHLTTAFNSQSGDNHETILRMLREVTSVGETQDLTDLGGAVLVAGSLQKGMAFRKKSIVKSWENALKLNTGSKIGEYASAHLATGLLQAAPGFMLNLFGVADRIERGYSRYLDTTGNAEAAAVLTALLMKNQSSFGIQQQLDKWYKEAQAIIGS